MCECEQQNVFSSSTVIMQQKGPFREFKLDKIDVTHVKLRSKIAMGNMYIPIRVYAV